jgi:hypothetical protein
LGKNEIRFHNKKSSQRNGAGFTLEKLGNIFGKKKLKEDERRIS